MQETLTLQDSLTLVQDSLHLKITLQYKQVEPLVDIKNVSNGRTG